MKYISLLLVSFLFTLTTNAQKKSPDIHTPDTIKQIFVVEAACGQCRFKMKGKGCELAIRMNGKSYFVDGAKIDDYGDAHAKNGFCKATRKAEVQGTIKGDRFVATYFKLIDR